MFALCARDPWTNRQQNDGITTSHLAAYPLRLLLNVEFRCVDFVPGLHLYRFEATGSLKPLTGSSHTIRKRCLFRRANSLQSARVRAKRLIKFLAANINPYARY